VARPAWRGGSSQRGRRKGAERSVGFLVRVIRFIFWVVIATWLVRRLLGWMFPPSTARQVNPATPTVSLPKPLYRDPVCGTHVAPEISYTLQQGDQVLHFCSADCRERYRASLGRAANG
jgi:YHS domain-containing protein